MDQGNSNSVQSLNCISCQASRGLKAQPLTVSVASPVAQFYQPCSHKLCIYIRVPASTCPPPPCEKYGVRYSCTPWMTRWSERGASRMARPCGWQPFSGRSPMRTPTPTPTPRSRPLCNARSRCEGGLFTGAVYGSCRPPPPAQLRRLVGFSMAHSTAWPGGAHGSRAVHQRTPTPRGKSLRRSTRRRRVCLRQIDGSRGHPLPHLRCAVAHCGGSPQCADVAAHCRPRRNRSYP